MRKNSIRMIRSVNGRVNHIGGIHDQAMGKLQVKKQTTREAWGAKRKTKKKKKKRRSYRSLKTRGRVLVSAGSG